MGRYKMTYGPLVLNTPCLQNPGNCFQSIRCHFVIIVIMTNWQENKCKLTIFFFKLNKIKQNKKVWIDLWSPQSLSISFFFSSNAWESQYFTLFLMPKFLRGFNKIPKWLNYPQQTIYVHTQKLKYKSIPNFFVTYY